jgi:hypothetical protein
MGKCVGFTGTKNGMTDEQAKTVMEILMSEKPTTVVHGDCIGADADFDELVAGFKAQGVKVSIEIRPGTNENGASPLRAYTANANTVHAPKPYMKRNADIVRQCDLLIACPKEDYEKQRSGTWATVRRAWAANKPVYLVLPKGSVGKE